MLSLCGSGAGSDLSEDVTEGSGNTQEECEAACHHDRDEDHVIHQSRTQADQEDVEEAWEESPTEEDGLRENVEVYGELVMVDESTKQGTKREDLKKEGVVEDKVGVGTLGRKQPLRR